MNAPRLSIGNAAKDSPDARGQSHVRRHLFGHSPIVCMFMGPEHLDCLIHLDTDDLANVYRWRLQQEHALHRARNQGMTDAEVVAFVQGYMPAYELYLDTLRTGIFHALPGEPQDRKGQVRVVSRPGSPGGRDEAGMPQ
ncbi:hypothetical protein BO71DRAFT_436003 [Aspergillus ellipticus CBS 707.79]|uniref:Phosphoribulokinase/uridine kinase domain-containing protein n=1 Tax=Aspergillus ellipticus CBS 707.79 TaxID=1448320 RepID=A0A319CSN5_9EURO|nr:hypothetical protein BO71DRAFT_436003 [Aspergillus ellipticus CBS 707.79]